jgi:DNA-directed RNA polymerase II subunit RPB2
MNNQRLPSDNKDSKMINQMMDGVQMGLGIQELIISNNYKDIDNYTEKIEVGTKIKESKAKETKVKETKTKVSKTKETKPKEPKVKEIKAKVSKTKENKKEIKNIINNNKKLFSYNTTEGEDDEEIELDIDSDDINIINDNITSILNESTTNVQCESNINSPFDLVNDKYIEIPWSIIRSYYKNDHLKQLVRHQLESYNHFIDSQLIKTIEMFTPLKIVSEQDFDPKSNKYALEIYIEFENFNIYRPQIHENNGAIKLMFPKEARLRNFTYASAMTIDLNIKYVVNSGPNLENVQTFYKKLQKIHIGKMPIMVKSNICVLTQYNHVENTYTGECKYDTGGYFIINGSEKTILGQERAAENKVYCFNVEKNNTKYSWIAEVKSVPGHKCISPKQLNLMISNKNNGFGFPILMQIPRVKQPIPLFIVFRALGILSDKQICEIILLDIYNEKYKEMLQFLQGSIIDSNKFLTQDECIKYITSHVMFSPINMDKETGIKKKHEFAMDILNNDLFPHCHDKSQKILYLGYMTFRLIQANFDIIKQDDRDSYLNKRVDCAGSLLNNLFRNYFNKLIKDMEKQIIREINTGTWRSTDDYANIINSTNISKAIKSTTIENGIKRALATGDFGIKHTNSNRVGVAQVLSRLNKSSTVSHSRRIATPSDKSGKLIPPRKLHSTSWGFLCPAETPEGQSVGIVKNLSFMTHVTIHSNNNSLYDYVQDKIEPITMNSLENPSLLFGKVKVMINGCWYGNAIDPYNLYLYLKEKKYTGTINIYTSIVFDYKMKEIRVCNDSGRLTRPVLRIKNNNILFTKNTIQQIEDNQLEWNDLFTNCKLNESILEYIDPEEQSLNMIAIRPYDIVKPDNQFKYTHSEIHPSTLFGILASCIPYPEHNQSPRNTYQCAMGKQAVGMYATNYDERMDKTAYLLHYGSKPLVNTRIMDILKLNEIPSGVNITVAIMSYTGYNQEDSLLVNKGSIDRGLFMASIYHTEKDEDKQKINGDEEVRCKPDPAKTKGMKFGNYNKVNSKGVVPENTLIQNRDIIIAKTTPIKGTKNDPTKEKKYEDQSRIYKTTEETFIDKNYIDKNGDGYTFAKVRLRCLRKPTIGDKFSSRHGQKGTVGNIIPEENMPFTKDGIRPDIIINPHAIPSRMTIGQLKETLLGKVLLELGLFGDGTSFGDLEVKDIRKKLLELGYESNGNEILYDGLSGTQLQADIFIGPVFYQRLKHMVSDKQHSRSIGPMVNLTRQPAEGRSRDGGLRFGEMERDCFVEDSPIATSSGYSVKIKDMESCDYEVLGWSEKENGMVKAKQIGFMSKGERPCVEITLEDGRKSICTENHPILTSENKWVEAKDLVINQSKCKVSVTCPLIDIVEEIKKCNGWSLQVGSLTLTTNTREEYLKTLAFARLIGYLITDGSISSDKKDDYLRMIIYLGHILDVESVLNDLSMFCVTNQRSFTNNNLYYVTIPNIFAENIIQLPGLLKGRKVGQPGTLPEFILSQDCPISIIREFLGGMFGGDGHTCHLGMHRGKRDLLTSISFSQTKKYNERESLIKMIDDVKTLLQKCGIEKVSIQELKETSSSKERFLSSEFEDKTEKSYQLTLHLEMDELIPFSEKIGFRYCCHKSQHLEAGVSYKRLKNEVIRQHNWLVNRVNEITNFRNIKKESPFKHVPTKKAIEQSISELKLKEPLLHEYAIPSTHDITDHLMKGTTFGKFTSKGFPTAEEFLRNIGALDWFLEEKYDSDSNIESSIEYKGEKVANTSYGVKRESNSLPTMEMKVKSIIPVGMKKVYDIEVENVHSFLVNGFVAHNCMISHGASRFTKGRMYDASDKYQVHVCNKCGLIASYNDEYHIHLCKVCDNRTDFSYVQIPYACKLLFQELITMNVVPRIMTENMNK